MKAKRPAELPESTVQGYELLANEVRNIFKKHHAPPDWADEEAVFFLSIIDRPELLQFPNMEGSSIQDIWKSYLRHRDPVNDCYARPFDAITFFNLYAVAPEPFLKIIGELRKRVKAREASPQHKVTTWLLTQWRMGKDWVWDDAGTIARLAEKHLGWRFVTPGMVHHARNRLKRVKAWKF